MTSTETSFAKGLRVLGALMDYGPMRIETIAQETGLPVSSVYRYARDLIAAEILENDNGVYSPGERLAQLARVTSWTDRLSRFGLPVLRELTERTGETSMVTVRVGQSALVVDRVESKQAIRLSFQRGSLRALYAGASAKVLLAYAPQSVVDAILNAPMPTLGDNTPTPSVLRRQLADVRSRRYAISFSEADSHAVGVAVPVFCGKELIGGLSVAGPAWRLDHTQARHALRQVQAAATQLTHALELDAGFHPDERSVPDPLQGSQS